MYQNGPLTKADMLHRLNNGQKVDQKFAKNFQIKRAGRDKDNYFWNWGKLHGLENIVYVDENEAAQAFGDPWKMQILLNKANDAPKPLPPHSFDQLVENLQNSMIRYRNSIDGNKHEFFGSDRKKMLALPFLMARQAELPEPKKGQKEWEIFADLYGKQWDEYKDLMFDTEDKITEFNYENFIPAPLLKTMDPTS